MRKCSRQRWVASGDLVPRAGFESAAWRCSRNRILTLRLASWVYLFIHEQMLCFLSPEWDFFSSFFLKVAAIFNNGFNLMKFGEMTLYKAMQNIFELSCDTGRVYLDIFTLSISSPLSKKIINKWGNPAERRVGSLSCKTLPRLRLILQILYGFVVLTPLLAKLCVYRTCFAPFNFSSLC